MGILSLPVASIVPLDVVRGRVEIRVAEINRDLVELYLVLEDFESTGQVRRRYVIRFCDHLPPALLGRAGPWFAVEDVVEIVHEGKSGRQCGMVQK